MKHSLVFFLFCLLTTEAIGAVLTGTVYESDSLSSVPYATIRVLGSGQSILANEKGAYRLILSPGNYAIKVSHVSHHSETFTLDISESDITNDIYLKPALIEVAPIEVFDRQYDAAQRIILEAIKRKEQLLTQIQQYRFEAYTKLIIRDTVKADSIDIFMITETQLEAFWRYPDQYKEILLARKQSSNIKAENNLVTIGEILNFNKNRIDMGRYSIVSPTAKDALDHYNYYLMDTILIDGKTVFVLEVEPKNKLNPLFTGTIKIADSSFAVVGVDVGLSEGFDTIIFSKLRLRQECSEFENGYWMPTLIQYTGIIDVKLPLISVFSFDYIASLHNYAFGEDAVAGKIDELALEVHEKADDRDSSYWQLGQLMPLTLEEMRGYFRIDSLEHAPKPFYKYLLGGTFMAGKLVFFSPDFFHFNRVEGAYLGLGINRYKASDRLDLTLKTGYAIDGEYWQHQYGFNYFLKENEKLGIFAEYHDRIRTMTTILTPPDNYATMSALIVKEDPYDYYLEKGFNTGISYRLNGKFSSTVSYHDYNQYSTPNYGEPSLFRDSSEHRVNPAIREGKYRSLAGTFRFDSRPQMKDKGKVKTLLAFPYYVLETGVEKADPDFIDNDFNFVRYYGRIYSAIRLGDLGISSLFIYGGSSTKDLPPQKYFVVNHDAGPGFVETANLFSTLGEHNFYGNRVFLAYIHHDLGRRLFQKSGIPILKDSPFGLSVHGGVFWSEFKEKEYFEGDENFFTAAKRPYSELGFGLSRILPLGIQIGYTWQLSAYPTNRSGFTLMGSF